MLFLLLFLFLMDKEKSLNIYAILLRHGHLFVQSFSGGVERAVYKHFIVFCGALRVPWVFNLCGEFLGIGESALGN